jgi:hypothetical protein
MAKEYIKAASEKKLAAIQAALGEDNLAYDVINKANAKKHRLKDLKTGAMMNITDTSSMLTILDGRMRIVELDVLLGQKLTWMYSFRLRTAECIGCKQHINTTPYPRRGSQRGGRQAIWLTDHSMPPLLPVTHQSLHCVKIIRLEGGMLQELAEGLVRTLSGRQIAAGSTVFLTSVTNMAAAGAAGYADDLFRAIKFLRRSLGDHLVFGAIPNLFLNGSEDPITIRTCWEFVAWAKFTFREEASLLYNSFNFIKKQLIKRGAGGV